MLNEVMIANKNYASVVVEDRKRLDLIAINVIRYDCPAFLLPIRLVSIDNEVQLRYEILGGIRLAYMALQMNKHELDKLLYQLLLPYVDCADWFLDFHNIYLDRNYIMVDQSNLTVRYIYMPYTDRIQSEEEVLQFFRDLVASVTLQDDEAYIATLLRCIIGKDASITVFADLVKENLKKEEMPTGNKGAAPVQVTRQIPAPTTVPSPPPIEKSVSQSVEIEAEVDKAYKENKLVNSIGEGLFGENEKGPDKKTAKKEKQNFFGRLLGSDKKNKKDAFALSEPGNQDRIGAPNIMAALENERHVETFAEKQQNSAAEDYNTEISDDVEDLSGILRLRLERAQVDNIPNVIDLDIRKGYAVIGRYDKTGKLSADFNFDMSLTFIGRRHVRFELSGEDVYIIDLESKNHTYLNNEELLPNRRYLLHTGDRITITQKYGIVYQVC